jgi:hypothetical protein
LCDGDISTVKLPRDVFGLKLEGLSLANVHIKKIEAEISELNASEICRLKTTVEEASRKGSDVLGDLVESLAQEQSMQLLQLERIKEAIATRTSGLEVSPTDEINDLHHTKIRGAPGAGLGILCSNRLHATNFSRLNSVSYSAKCTPAASPGLGKLSTALASSAMIPRPISGGTPVS